MFRELQKPHPQHPVSRKVAKLSVFGNQVSFGLAREVVDGGRNV